MQCESKCLVELVSLAQPVTVKTKTTLYPVIGHCSICIALGGDVFTLARLVILLSILLSRCQAFNLLCRL